MTLVKIPQEETLKSLKIVADEIMTMENNIFQMTDVEKNSRGLKRIKRAIKNLEIIIKLWVMIYLNY